ncbi:unnamed protein product [Albugo candida]|uniref:CSN8/PSMD8/EIF3K domain-containing protein n=1 Tax=Albugo candida TaxID=65357 RepID=A0A024G703_9STRA|nr:unnamed protein product [Albugo candida]|eukprot:CCI42413.1 unnamed protein product [Albugo candida]
MDVLQSAKKELTASLLSDQPLQNRNSTAKKLKHVMEDFELRVLAANPNDSHPLTHDFYSTLLAVILISGNLDDARYLWKRLSHALKLHTEILALHAIFKALQMRKMAETYLIIEQTAWRTDFQPIIACLRGVLRDRVIQSIRETYLSIDIQLAAQMLGFSFVNADFQAFCHQIGWKLNTQKSFLYPEPIAKEVEHPIKVAQLEDFAQSILHLEENITSPAFS